MNIVLGVLGKIVVDDMRHTLDVQPSAGHVGGDEDWKLAVFEIREYFQSLGLRKVAGNGSICNAVCFKHAFQAFRCHLHVAEYKIATFRLTPDHAKN